MNNLFFDEVSKTLDALSEAMDILESTTLIEKVNRIRTIRETAEELRDDILSLVDVGNGD